MEPKILSVESPFYSEHMFCIMEPRDRVKSNFLSTEDIEKVITNRKKNINKKKLNQFKTRQVQIRKKKPLSIFKSQTYEEGTFVEVNNQK